MYTYNNVCPQRPIYQFQQDMFCQDQAIACDKKRHKDSVYIQLLTHTASQVLPERNTEKEAKEPLESVTKVSSLLRLKAFSST